MIMGRRDLTSAKQDKQTQKQAHGSERERVMKKEKRFD